MSKPLVSAPSALRTWRRASSSPARFDERLSPGDDPLGGWVLARFDSGALAAGGRRGTERPGHAKGLEFPCVVMVGVEEEFLPHKRTLELGGSLVTARRLCYVGYVACAAARKRLCITLVPAALDLWLAEPSARRRASSRSCPRLGTRTD